MHRLVRRAAVSLSLGLVAALVMASAAQALTITVPSQSILSFTTNLTLRDSALGNISGNRSVGLSINATTFTSFPTTIGSATSGSWYLTSPATGINPISFSPTWPVVVTGLAGGGLAITIQRPKFTIAIPAWGVTANYSGGSIQGVVGASPASFYTVSGSSIPSDIGSTGSILTGFAFAVGPALTYTIVP